MSVALVGPNRLAERAAQAGDGVRRSDHAQHVVPCERRAGQQRELVAAAKQRADARAVRRQARVEFAERRADERAVGHDDLGLVEIEVARVFVGDLRPEARCRPRAL